MFDTIIKEGTYADFKSYCEDNGFIIEESIDDGSYVFSLTKSEEGSDILINGIVTKDDVTLYITDDNGKVIDKISENYDNEDELLSYLKGTLVTSNLLSGETGLIDGDEILTEDSEESDSEYSTIPGGLEEIKNKIQNIGDLLKDLSELSNSLEIISIVMDLANSAYSFALDIDDSIATYNEIMEIPEEPEELDPDIDGEDTETESKKVAEAKLSVAKAMLLVRGMNLGENKVKRFENFCKSLFD